MSRRLNDPLVADQDSRRLAQSEFNRPVVVVAGAGTGKTALLVARVAAWCVGPGWDLHTGSERDRQTVARRVIERVVAITFTDAAAAEMAKKIGLAFLELAAGEQPVGWDPEPGLLPNESEEIKRRARALSEEGHRLVVSTIHAFCQRILATYPLEAGVHPSFQVDADGSRIERLVEEVVENALRGLADDPTRSQWERLAVEGVDPGTIVEVLCLLVEAGADPAVFGEDPFGEEALGNLFRRVRSILGRVRATVGDRLEEVSGPVSVATRDALEAMEQYLAAVSRNPDMEDVVALAESIDPRVAPRLKKWSRLDFTGSERSCLDEVAHDAAPAFGELSAVLGSLVEGGHEELDSARIVVAPLLTEVHRRRHELGLVTFSDLIRLAAEVLERSAGVRRDVARGIDHLLVDEFQDTDEVQCRLVESLALSDDIDPPSLFIVGDPKQSIYAWRSADLAAYDAFVGKVMSLGGEKVDLVRNFRSFTPVLDEVKALVAPVMRRETGIQPEFQPLEATEERRGARGIDQPPWMTVEHWLTWPRGEKGVGREKKSDRRTTELEARAIAADIRALHGRGVIKRWGEVAILLRVTTAQNEILAELRKAGVPYEVARERDYYRQREVVELAALVRCILEPTDVLALLTVLRSDVVGVPDAVLLPLWEAGLPEAVAMITDPESAAVETVRTAVRCAGTALPDVSPGADALPMWPDCVVDAVEIIAVLRRSMREDSPDVFVERIRTLWLAEATAAARYLGRFRRARLDRFLVDLETALVSDRVSDAELARFLRFAVEQGRESRVPVPPDLEADAVHVMTIHKAKGLDFEHVYVAQVHKGSRVGGGAGVAGLRCLDGRTEYKLFGWATPGFAAAEWRRERKARAEMVRLLYVATTRAKKRLVLSGGWGEPDDEKPPEASPDFARLIGRRLDPASVAGQIASEEPRVFDDEVHVVRVMPVFDPGVHAPGSGRIETSQTSVPEERLARARELAAARRDAAERMKDSFFRSASAEAHDRLRRSEAEAEHHIDEITVDRDLAMALGSAIHRVLELVDLEGDLAAQIAAQRDCILRELSLGRNADDVKQRLDDLLGRLLDGGCLRRLASQAGAVVARELPVVMWREEGDEPGAVISGIIDLVYRDHEDGRLVVADFKTDAVETDAEVDGRIEAYSSQLEIYANALEKALDLDHRPHTELWFLWADRIERLVR